LEDKVRDVECF